MRDRGRRGRTATVLVVGALVLLAGACGAADGEDEQPVSVSGRSEADVWVASAGAGQLTLLDGRDGRVLERVVVGKPRESIQVASDGGVAVYINRTTGEVGVVERSGAVGGPVDTDVRSQGRVFVGGGNPYLLDAEEGTVTFLDRSTAAAVGTVEIGSGPVGRGAVDEDGVLWLLEPLTGDLVAFDGANEVDRVEVQLVDDGIVTMTSSGPVVVDAMAGVLFSSGGVRMAVEGGTLEGFTAMRADASSDLLWMASGDRLVAVDPADGARAREVELEEGQRGAPVLADGVVYVPGPAADEVTVVDPTSGEAEVVAVGTEEFELVPSTAGVVVNELDGPTAGLLEAGGSYQTREKYEPREARTTTTPTTAPPTTPPTTGGSGGSGGGGGGGQPPPGGGGGGTTTTQRPTTTTTMRPTTTATVCISDC